jgi:hypothetical protein
MSVDLKKSSSQVKPDFSSSIVAAAIAGLEAHQHDRLALLARHTPPARALVNRVLAVAKHGLPKMYNGEVFVHTLRALKTANGWTEQPEGISLRYTAMVALGLSHVDQASRTRALGGGTIADLLQHAMPRALHSSDTGSKALVAWASAETVGIYATSLFDALRDHLVSGAPISTVECAWILSAAIAAHGLIDTTELISMARTRLLSARSSSPLFGPMVPASASGSFRSHIGCFADQVYPIQALSRLHAAFADVEALTIAEACAEKICALQGKDGEWWWHYDSRHGTVAEGYPVYSVHQHAMAPMALLELREAGGADFSAAIVTGLQWLEEHPEVIEALIVPEKGVVWRKVARREPSKMARKLAAIGTAISPKFRLPMLDLVFPPVRIDHECRPYEFGLLFYAWLSGGTVAKLMSERANALPS